MGLFIKLIAFHLLLSGFTFAQEENVEIDFVRNIIFVEAGGNGFLFSINYERLLTKSAGIRVGAGTANTSGTSFPILFNCYIGGTPKLELGAGINYILGKSGSESIKEGILLTGTLGLRYQKPNGGIIFKIGITPFMNPVDTSIIFWGGVSLGYAFR